MTDSINKNVYFDEELHVSVVRYSGFLSLAEFKELTLSGDATRAARGTNVQLDVVQDVKVLSQEIQEWTKVEWFPHAIAKGLKYIAFVVPASALASISMKSVN